MFGGGMPQVWPFAAVVLQYLDGFLDNYRKSLAHADLFFEQITKNEKIRNKKMAEVFNSLSHQDGAKH